MQNDVFGGAVKLTGEDKLLPMLKVTGSFCKKRRDRPSGTERRETLG